MPGAPRNVNRNYPAPGLIPLLTALTPFTRGDFAYLLNAKSAVMPPVFTSAVSPDDSGIVYFRGISRSPGSTFPATRPVPPPETLRSGARAVTVTRYLPRRTPSPGDIVIN